jgi:hypothetical protein
MLSNAPLVGPFATIGYQIKDMKDYGGGRTAKKDLFERLQTQLLFPTSSQGSGLGVNFNHTAYENQATAEIRDGAIVYSQDDVKVTANTHNLLIDLTAAGAKSDGWFGIGGSGNWNDIDSTAIALIGDDAVVWANNDVIVDADTNTVLVSFNAAMTHGAGLGVGLTATVTTLDNTVQAIVGDGVGSQLPETFTSGNIAFNSGAKTAFFGLTESSTMF